MVSDIVKTLEILPSAARLTYSAVRHSAQDRLHEFEKTVSSAGYKDEY